MEPLTLSGVARVVVHIKELSGCVQCDATKRKLDELNVPYDTIGIDLPEHADLLQAIKDRNHLGAPVVILYNANGTERDIWTGYRPDLIAEHFPQPARAEEVDE